MNNNKNMVVLSDDPLVRVDFGRISLADNIRLLEDNRYAFTLLLKCALDDLNSIPGDFTPQIIRRFSDELTIFLSDITNTYNLLYATQ